MMTGHEDLEEYFSKILKAQQISTQDEIPRINETTKDKNDKK